MGAKENEALALVSKATLCVLYIAYIIPIVDIDYGHLSKLFSTSLHTASTSAPLVAAVAGGVGAGLLTTVLTLAVVVIIPIIVVVLHCRRKSR